MFVLNITWKEVKTPKHLRSMLLRNNKPVLRPCLDKIFEGVKGIQCDLYKNLCEIIPTISLANRGN